MCVCVCVFTQYINGIFYVNSISFLEIFGINKKKTALFKLVYRSIISISKNISANAIQKRPYQTKCTRQEEGFVIKLTV